AGTCPPSLILWRLPGSAHGRRTRGSGRASRCKFFFLQGSRTSAPHFYFGPCSPRSLESAGLIYRGAPGLSRARSEKRKGGRRRVKTLLLCKLVWLACPV